MGLVFSSLLKEHFTNKTSMEDTDLYSLMIIAMEKGQLNEFYLEYHDYHNNDRSGEAG
jgi:hypothetical protein